MNSILFFYPEVKKIGDSSYCVKLSKSRTNYVRTAHKLRANNEIKLVASIYGIGSGLANLKIEENLIGSIKIDSVSNIRSRLKLVVGSCRPQSVKEILRISVMLGVEELIFYNSEVGEKSYLKSKQLKEDAVYHQVLCSLEQAVDSYGPAVRVSWTLEKALKLSLIDEKSSIKICADTSSEDATFDKKLDIADSEYSKILVIGSELGFSKYEKELLKSKGFAFVSLGSRILRVGTAATVLLSRNI